MTNATTPQLQGGFTLPTWDGEPYAEIPGADGTEQYSRVHLAKVFTGDLTGTSSGDLLMVGLPSGAAAYVGLERVEATIGDRSGTFVLQHSAAGHGTQGWMSVAVVPGSATGDLDGLTGEMTIAKSPEGVHTYTLDAVLPERAGGTVRP